MMSRELPKAARKKQMHNSSILSHRLKWASTEIFPGRVGTTGYGEREREHNGGHGAELPAGSRGRAVRGTGGEAPLKLKTLQHLYAKGRPKTLLSLRQDHINTAASKQTQPSAIGPH